MKRLLVKPGTRAEIATGVWREVNLVIQWQNNQQTITCSDTENRRYPSELVDMAQETSYWNVEENINYFLSCR